MFFAVSSFYDAPISILCWHMTEGDMTLDTWDDKGGYSHWAALTMEHLAQGVAILDEHSTLMFANSAARTAMEKAGWEIRQERLLCKLAVDRQAWIDALHRTCQQGKHALLELHAQGGEASIFVSLTPLELAGLPVALATFEREHLCDPLELQMFASSHGLTLAENQVLQRLCQGQRPSQIAVEHGVARTTVLTQVAAIRVKTRRDSVIALLHKLSRLPHGARPHAASAPPNGLPDSAWATTA
jgi:DNA-binding CsgD family transcriptional regulator